MHRFIFCGNLQNPRYLRAMVLFNFLPLIKLYIMETATIKTKSVREKLFNLINGLDDERLYYLYEFLKPKEQLNDEIETEEDTSAYYTEAFVAELDRRWEDYKNGKNSFTEEEMDARTEVFLKTLRASKNV